MMYAGICGAARVAQGDTVVINGFISQSTADGTGPAVNNSSLNSIGDGDSFSLTVQFAGSIPAPGTYSTLPSAVVAFSDPSASATETSFTSTSLTFSTDPSDSTLLDASFLACLSTGSGCSFGNQLSANFSLPASDLNQPSAAAGLIPGLSPSLDLLEDDGVTDIQGVVSNYSYQAVPEPVSSAAIAGALTLLLGFRVSQRRSHNKSVLSNKERV